VKSGNGLWSVTVASERFGLSPGLVGVEEFCSRACCRAAVVRVARQAAQATDHAVTGCDSMRRIDLSFMTNGAV
jgi:hypothetical protein